MQNRIKQAMAWHLKLRVQGRLLGTIQGAPANVAAAEAICPLHLIDCLQAR